jgi:DNA-binding MarR family transcriptional regulator
VARRSASPASRPDLAAMVVPLGRRLMAAEEPILEQHGLTMWAYVVLSALVDRDAPTQAKLARVIGADKTRIIGVLDVLQEGGLIERRPDPSDRRAYGLSITAAGRQLHAAAQADIQRGEERWLGRLTAADRATFLAALQTLARRED